MDPETLVLHYLGDLEAAAADLTADRRAELVGDLRGHIELALAEAGSIDEKTVREVLARLGTPAEIVAAELEPPSLGSPRRGRPETRIGAWWRGLSIESRALGIMTVGAVVLPFLGPLLGLWCVSGSARWTLAQKRTAALIVLVLLALPAFLILPAVAAGELTWVFTSAGFTLPLVPLAGFSAAAYLVLTASVEFGLAHH